jgi:hypothetical protein
MSKGACTFRKSDVTRLLSAAAAAHVKVARVEIQVGKITLVPDHDGADTESSSNEWNDVK